jgi:hypothetical protein
MRDDDGQNQTGPFMLRQTGAGRAANLPESVLLYKRPASQARRALDGLTDFADITAPGMSFALSGPSVRLDPGHLPVPHTVRAGEPAHVLKAGRADAEVLAELGADEEFNVLDFTGGWAWGQIGEDGVVGYVAASALVVVP